MRIYRTYINKASIADISLLFLLSTNASSSHFALISEPIHPYKSLARSTLSLAMFRHFSIFLLLITSAVAFLTLTERADKHFLLSKRLPVPASSSSRDNEPSTYESSVEEASHLLPRLGPGLNLWVIQGKGADCDKKPTFRGQDRHGTAATCRADSQAAYNSIEAGIQQLVKKDTKGYGPDEPKGQHLAAALFVPGHGTWLMTSAQEPAEAWIREHVHHDAPELAVHIASQLANTIKHLQYVSSYI